MIKVNDVMTLDPAACRVNASVMEVARMMLDNDCGQIPVIDEQGRPIGVLTDRDIAVRVVANGRDGNTRAADAMTTPCKTVAQDSSLKDCICLMEAEKIRRVPVVDTEGKLVGMVAQADIALTGKNAATAEVVREVSAPGGAGPS